MKAWEISDAFRAQFAADAAFTGVKCLPAQSGDDYTTPIITFNAKTASLNASGSALMFSLAIWVESNAGRVLDTDPQPGAVHADRVSLVTAKILGDGKASMLAAMNAVGNFDFRGWGAVDSDLETHASAFRTPLAITGTVLVL